MSLFIRSTVAVCFGLGVLLVAPAVVYAKGGTTISFTATVADVHDPYGILCVGINTGDTITGTYTYDAKTPDTNNDPTVGDYWSYASPNGIGLTVNGQQTSTDPDNTAFLVELVNRDTDNYLLRSYTNLPWSCGTPVDHIAWQLDDPSGTALKSDKLKKKPPVLKSFQSVFGLTIQGGGYATGYFIRADVTSVR